MSAPVRIGITGCGDLTIRGILPHLTQPDAREKMDVAAVCDIDGDAIASIEGPLETVPRLEGIHSRLPEAQVYADIVHLVDCLRGGRDLASHPSQTCHLVELVEKAYLAARTGIAQKLLTTF